VLRHPRQALPAEIASVSLIHAKQRRRGYRISGVGLPAQRPVPSPHYVDGSRYEELLYE